MNGWRLLATFVGTFVPLAFMDSEAMLVGWLMFCLFVVTMFFLIDKIRHQYQVERLTKEKLTVELSLLKSQINPHFFFNTLHNIYGLAIQNSEKAPEVILKLADLMRYTIYRGQENQVTLEEEIHYIESFIALQKIRLHKKFEITFEKRIENPQHKIVPLLLIILVENAFKHGVEKLPYNTFIKINCVEDTQGISFEISNNFDEEEQYPDGIGLQNLQQRLQLTYPQTHTLKIDKQGNKFFALLNIRN